MWLNIQHHLNSVLYNRTRWNGSQTAISIFISCQPLEGPSLVTSWCRPACCSDNVPEGHVHKLCSCHKEISGSKHELTFSLTSEFFILIFLQHGFFFCVCARLCILANIYAVVFVSSRVWRRKTSHCPSRIYLHFPARRHPITHHTSNTEGIT